MEVSQDPEHAPETSPQTTSFSFGRVGILLLIVVGAVVINGVMQLPKLLEEQRARDAQEQQRQQELRRQVDQLRKSASEGQGGEALNRLFGIDPDEAARRRNAANNSSANLSVEKPPSEQEPVNSP